MNNRILILGFTLIEMLIAIAIGAGISVMAYTALTGAIRADEKVSEVTKTLDEVDRVWQYMASDFLYAVPRIWRDLRGSEKSALIGVGDDRLSQSDLLIVGEEDYLVQFIRGNRENLINQARSDLYMVGYRLTLDSDTNLKTLWRDTWAPVDGAESVKIRQRQLLEGIDTLSIAYLPASFSDYAPESWLQQWPTTTGVSPDLPAAIRVSLETEAMGRVERVFGLSEP